MKISISIKKARRDRMHAHTPRRECISSVHRMNRVCIKLHNRTTMDNWDGQGDNSSNEANGDEDEADAVYYSSSDHPVVDHSLIRLLVKAVSRHIAYGCPQQVAYVDQQSLSIADNPYRRPLRFRRRRVRRFRQSTMSGGVQYGGVR